MSRRHCTALAHKSADNGPKARAAVKGRARLGIEGGREGGREEKLHTKIQPATYRFPISCPVQ